MTQPIRHGSAVILSVSVTHPSFQLSPCSSLLFLLPPPSPWKTTLRPEDTLPWWGPAGYGVLSWGWRRTHPPSPHWKTALRPEVALHLPMELCYTRPSRVRSVVSGDGGSAGHCCRGRFPPHLFFLQIGSLHSSLGSGRGPRRLSSAPPLSVVGRHPRFHRRPHRRPAPSSLPSLILAGPPWAWHTYHRDVSTSPLRRLCRSPFALLNWAFHAGPVPHPSLVLGVIRPSPLFSAWPPHFTLLLLRPRGLIFGLMAPPPSPLCLRAFYP